MSVSGSRQGRLVNNAKKLTVTQLNNMGTRALRSIVTEAGTGPHGLAVRKVVNNAKRIVASRKKKTT